MSTTDYFENSYSLHVGMFNCVNIYKLGINILDIYLFDIIIFYLFSKALESLFAIIIIYILLLSIFFNHWSPFYLEHYWSYINELL